MGQSDARCWAGVDVGGARKGFHVAIVDERREIELREFRGDDPMLVVRDLVTHLRGRSPLLVAVDAPQQAAENGRTMRTCERAFLDKKICKIFFTPDAMRIETNSFYGWVIRGQALYAELARSQLPAIECFPTSAWTRWGHGRGTLSRAAWSSRILERVQRAHGLRFRAPPSRLSQDSRDAIAAALTARLHHLESPHTENLHGLVIPLEGSEAHLFGRREF